MAMRLPDDFKEFLRLLSSHEVEYLLIGGYAVGQYGYPRATADMDIWVAISPENARRVVAALEAFGFSPGSVSADLFLAENRVVTLGVPPFRLELLTTISGVTFADCFARRIRAAIDGVDVSLISLADLKANKAASGRLKDLDDLQHLPPNRGKEEGL
jgi:predicted nucleotidyltransferase